MAENITTISIAAKADTKKAESSIDKLAQSFERLRVATDFSISKGSAKSIRRVSEALAGLSNVGKVNIGKDLPARIDAFAKSLENLSTVNISRLKEIADAMKTIKASGISGLSIRTKESTSVKANGIQQGADMGLVEHRATTAVDSTNASLASQRSEADKTAGSWERLKQKLNSVVAAMKSVKKTSDETKELGDSASRATSKFGQLLAAIKRIAVYRAIRTALKAITQAFREGISNLYQYSVLMDGTFKRSMDMLATSALYLKNSLGAMVAPIINALAPAIDILVDKFVDLLNIFNQFLAMITGASTWTKALKYPKQYAENMERAGGAAKELRATLLGFDEINRLDDLKARGGGGGTPGMDYSQMFEEVPLIKKSLSDMWEDFLEGGKSKFALWAAGLAGILSLKLSGGLTGIFGGAAGSASLMSGFTATLLAAFAGFRLGNWLYYNVPGIKNFADDLMDAGLGKAIMDFQESVEEGWDLMIDGMIEWGDKINGFFADVKQGWKLMHDAAIEWGDKIAEKFDKIKKKATDFVDKLIEKYEKIKGVPKATEKDWQNFTNDIISAFTSAGLIFDGSQYQVKVKFLGDETEIVDWWNDHRNELGAGGFGGGGGGTTGTPGSPEMPKTGGGGGNDVFNAIENGMKDLAKTANGIVQAIPNQSYVPAYYTKKAKGGSVDTGDLFLANEKEPELIGHIGNKTQVANNDQITESIRLATAEGNAEGNMLLRQAVAALNGLLAKDTTVEAVVTADSITNGLARQNLRNGRTTVAVG